MYYKHSRQYSLQNKWDLCVWSENLSSANLLARCIRALAANWKVKGARFIESDVTKATATTNNGIPAIQLEIRVLAGWDARKCCFSTHSLVRSLAPDAHAYALRSTLARIRTCTHLDQWSADHPARKTSRKTLAVRPTKIDRQRSSLVIRSDVEEPVDHSRCSSHVQFLVSLA